MKENRREFLSNVIKTAGIAAGIGLLGTSTLNAKGGKGKKGKTEDMTELTEHLKEEIFYIYQEEKVARDVYITLGKLYPDENTFTMIQLSEQRHIEAVGRLCEKYDIYTMNVDLSENGVGIFELESLQKLYDSLIIQGKIDLREALYVGKDIEVLDINDIEAAKEGMPEDVVRVFDNLLKGSRNHLAAFERAITREED